MLNMLFENVEILVLLINTIGISVSYILFLSYIVNGFTLYAIPLFFKVILPILASMILTVYVLFKAYRAIQDEMEDLEVELQSYRDSVLTYYNKYRDLQQMIISGGNVDTAGAVLEMETSHGDNIMPPIHQQEDSGSSSKDSRSSAATLSSSETTPPSNFSVTEVMNNSNTGPAPSSYVVKVRLIIPDDQKTLYQKAVNALVSMGYLKTNSKEILVHKQIHKEKNIARKIQDETKRCLKSVGIHRPTVVIEAMLESQAEDYIAGIGA